MSRYELVAEIEGQPAQIVKRNIASPAIADGILFVDDLGVKIGDDVNIAEGLTLMLRIKPKPGS